MTQIASLRAHTDAFIDALEEVLYGTVVEVGDAQKPAGSGWQATPGQSDFVPYAIVYPWSGFTFDGNVTGFQKDAAIEWQVTCVGRTREQCEFVQDAAFQLIGQPLDVAGRDVRLIRLGSAGGGVREDETVAPKVWVSTPQLAVWSTPAD